MAENIFSLDIQDDLITGVLLKTGAQTTLVSSYGASLVEGRPLEEVITEVIDQVGVTDEACRVSLAANNFFFRHVSLPFSDKKKIDKILSFELEETAPQPIDSLIIDGIATAGNGEEQTVIAAMLDRDRLAEILAVLQSQGLDPEIVTISGVQTALRLALARREEDFLVLDIGVQRCSVIICKGGEVQLIRSIAFDSRGLADYTYGESLAAPVANNPGSVARTFGDLSSAVKITCFMAQELEEDVPIFLCGPVGMTSEAQKYLNEYFPGEVQGCALEELPSLSLGLELEEQWLPGLLDSALATGLRPLKTQKGFNFRKGEFAKKGSLKEYRHLLSKAVIPLVLLGFFLIGFLAYDTSVKKRKRIDLENRIRTVFSETLPGTKISQKPADQLLIRINEEKRRTASDKGGVGSYSVLDILAEISGRIPPSLKVKITRLVMEKGDLRIKGNTDNFNTVDNIKKVLEKSSFFKSVIISSANLAPKGGEVRFELKLQLSGV